MYRTTNRYPVFFTALAIVCLVAGIASAAIVSPAITYQGRLTDAAGNPLTGTYSVTFRLYDMNTGGTALSTDTHAVTAANGLFTTPVTISSPSVMNGRALWLGVKAGSDPEMTPRQEIRPVPYALSLRPGAVIEGSGISDVLKISKVEAKGAGINVTMTGASSAGFSANTTGVTSPGVAVRTLGTGSDGIVVLTNGDSAPGISAYATGGYSPVLEGTTMGHYSNGITISTYGFSSNGVYTRTLGPESVGVYAHTNGQGSNAVFAETYGAGSAAVTAYSAEADSPGMTATTQGGNSAGLRVFTHGPSSNGIDVITDESHSKGMSLATNGDYSGGITITTHGENSDGLTIGTENTRSSGITVATFGQTSPGVTVQTQNQGSPGFSALTQSDNSAGVYLITLGAGSAGISSMTDGSKSHAVDAWSIGPGSNGINVTTEGLDSHGIMVTARQGVGIETNTYSGSIWYTGGSFRNFGAGNGAYGSSRNKYGIVGNTDRPDQKYGIYTDDYLYAKGTQVPSTDVAEYMPVSGDVTPGTVLVIGPDGKLRPSASAYDTGVAGIVSTAPGVTLGTKENGNPGEQPVAVAGRVPCRVDTSNGPVRPRDLLVSSDTPGHAMKAIDPPVGTVLGKAMGTLESGTGTIEVLVTLQ